jgi:hypothetical protein
LDAVDAAASGAHWDRRAGLSCERSTGAQDERRFNAFARSSIGGTWPVEGLVEVAAYGEVVWSWHPLLMSSRRRRVGPTGLKQTFNPSTTVTKGIRRRGEYEGNR